MIVYATRLCMVLYFQYLKILHCVIAQWPSTKGSKKLAYEISINLHICYYRPQKKFRKGNVFTPVCQSFCSRGVCIPACTGQAPLADTPQGRHPHPLHQQLLQHIVCILLECILVTVCNKVAKVMFLQVSVCAQGGAIPACNADGIPACLAAGLWGVGIPACLADFQAHTQGGSLGGSVQGCLQALTKGGSWGGSGPGPQPRGKLRGIQSRPTAKGEVEGDQPGGVCVAFCYGFLLYPSVMAFCCGLPLCPSGLVAWLKTAFWYGLLVESGLLLWPSGVIFCYGLLVWPSSKAFWCGGLLLWSSGWNGVC